MTDSTLEFRDWKTRYLDQLERHETEEQEWDTRRSELTKALIHVSLSANGLDAHLDELLDHLRVRARELADTKELAAIAQEASRSAESVSEARNQQFRDLLNASESLLNALLEVTTRRDLRNRLKRKLKQLQRHSPQVADVLADCASLLRAGAKAANHAPASEVEFTDDGAVDKVRDALRAVRDNLKVPDRLKSQASAADRLIESNQLGEQLPAALNSLGQLTARCTSYEEDRLRTFIKRITRQFDELETALLQSVDMTGGEAQDRFEKDIEGGVLSLRDAAKGTPDVEVLSGLVARQTKALLEVVKSFRDKENQRRMRFDASIQLLKDRLKDSKRECSELSQELATLRKRADLDPLTGLPNRNGLQERLQQDYDLAVRHGAPVSLLLIDLDHFKRINDTFGHQAGDRVLMELSDLFRSKLRKSDFAARYGGEEFVLVLPQTDVAEATIAAEKLRQSVVDRVFLFRGKRVEVSFSAGVAQLAARESIADWLKRADSALYEAKNNGRNQVSGAR